MFYGQFHLLKKFFFINFFEILYMKHYLNDKDLFKVI